jgi:hypothetical protein
MHVNFTGVAPEEVTFLSPPGLTVSSRNIDSIEKGVVRHLVTASMPGPQNMAMTNLVVSTSNKTPKQLTHTSLLVVEQRIKFSAPAYFWDGESVRLPLVLNAVSNVSLTEPSDSLKEQLTVQYDSDSSEICVTGRRDFARDEVIPLLIQLECDSTLETITTTLVRNR